MTYPDPIQTHLTGYTTTGQNHRTSSQSHIYLYRKSDAPDLFLKINTDEQDAPLSLEKTAMTWLSGKLPVPRVVAYHKHHTAEYLLTTRIPGLSAESDALKNDTALTVRLLAEGLRTIHSIPIADCPLPDYRAVHLIARAERQVSEGRVTTQTLANRNDPRTPTQALSQIHTIRPTHETPVFTHGDYCLPNIMIHNNALSGFIDWGSAGIGDPHRDFVAAQYSIRRNLGAPWIVPFFDAYGPRHLNKNTLAFYEAIYDLT